MAIIGFGIQGRKFEALGACTDVFAGLRWFRALGFKEVLGFWQLEDFACSLLIALGWFGEFLAKSTALAAAECRVGMVGRLKLRRR